jgi:hypothetical protein
MNSAKEKSIMKFVEAGLKKCLLKVNAVAPGAWRLEGLAMAAGTVPALLGPRLAGGERRSAVRVTVHSAPPFATLLLFSQRDAEHIYRSFVEDGLSAAIGECRHEITLIEIGNILLNSLANSIMNSLGGSAIPSVPDHFAADLPATEARVGGAGGAVFTVISATLAIEREGRTVQAEAMAILPAEIAAGL